MQYDGCKPGLRTDVREKLKELGDFFFVFINVRILVNWEIVYVLLLFTSATTVYFRSRMKLKLGVIVGKGRALMIFVSICCVYRQLHA